MLRARSDLGVVGAQVALPQQVAPVAVEAVLLVDKEHVRLVLRPGLLQHVRDRVLVPQPAVVPVAGRRQLLLQHLRANYDIVTRGGCPQPTATGHACGSLAASPRGPAQPLCWEAAAPEHCQPATHRHAFIDGELPSMLSASRRLARSAAAGHPGAGTDSGIMHLALL